jgi:hypothetical protein
MSGCLDNAQLPSLEGLILGDRRNKVAAVVSGILVSHYKEDCRFAIVSRTSKFSFFLKFFSGWWFALDAAAVYTDKDNLKDVFQICGVFATISMIM